MERILLHNCRALCLDDDRQDTPLDGAYVVVEGTRSAPWAPSAPKAPSPERSTAGATSSCPVWSTPTPTFP